MSNVREDAFNQWWNGVENFATRAERMDGESPEAIARAAFFAALASNKPEPQACQDHELLRLAREARQRMESRKDEDVDQWAEKLVASVGEPQAQATNEHTEQSERAELINHLNRIQQQVDAHAYNWDATLDETQRALRIIKDHAKAAALLAVDKPSEKNELAPVYYVAHPDGTHSIADPQPQPVPDDVVKDALVHAKDWIHSVPHGDNCYLSDNYEGDPGNRCNCGKDSILNHIDAAMLKEEK